MKTPRRKVWDLAGESHVNNDGTPRQRVLAVLYPGEPLTLQRQPDNPHDPNAIAVLAGRHEIGFIARADATELAPLLDAQVPHRAQLHELTGGRPDYPSFGARICIAWRDGQMLTPLPLDPGQTKHQQHMSTANGPDPALGSTNTPGMAISIAAAVIFVIACIAVAIIV